MSLQKSLQKRLQGTPEVFEFYGCWKTDNGELSRQAQEVTVSNSQILSWKPKPPVPLLDRFDTF